VAEVLHRRLADEMGEALGQHRARSAHLAGQRIHRPGVRRLLVHQGQALAHGPVAQAGEPAGVLGRELRHVQAQGLHHHDLGQLGQHALGARPGRARLVHRVLQRGFQPTPRVHAAQVHRHHARQRRQDRLEEARVAHHVAADQARRLAATAEVQQLGALAQDRLGVHLQRLAAGGRRHGVGVALRKDDDVAGAQAQRCHAFQRDQARAFQHVVIEQNAFRAQSQHLRQRGVGRRGDAPGCGEAGVEEDRPVELHDLQDLGQGIHRPITAEWHSLGNAAPLRRRRRRSAEHSQRCGLIGATHEQRARQ